MSFLINFKCTASELNRERRGYFDAFSRLCDVRLSDVDAPSIMSASNELLLYADPPETPIPDDLIALQAPTACFQIDTFSKPNWRALWSCLFDYVFLFHPGYERYFRRYNHKRVTLLPHAIAQDDYSGADPQRTFDVGWVGSVSGDHYKDRRRILSTLAKRYRMNEWQASYPESKTPEIYRSSRVVVNIGRDDHREDANIRCFEAMGSGALLTTSSPSELESLGFEEGVHFVGYSDESELFKIIDQFLNEEEKRRQIAETARALVVREHTYDARAEAVLQIVKADAGAHFAPARRWNQSRAAFVYFHYHCKRAHLAAAKKWFAELLARSPIRALLGLPLLVRCWQYNRRKSTDSVRAVQ